MSDPIKTTQFLNGARDWRIVSDGACAFFETDSLSQAAAFVDACSGALGWDVAVGDSTWRSATR